MWSVEGVGEGLGMFGLVTAADRFDCGFRWHYKKFITGDYLQWGYFPTSRDHRYHNLIIKRKCVKPLGDCKSKPQ